MSVRWAVCTGILDVLLCPSCGDGRFIARQWKSAGIEQDSDSAAVATVSARRETAQMGNVKRLPRHELGGGSVCLEPKLPC